MSAPAEMSASSLARDAELAAFALVASSFSFRVWLPRHSARRQSNWLRSGARRMCSRSMASSEAESEDERSVRAGQERLASKIGTLTTERFAKLADADLQHRIADARLRPHGVEQLIFRHQPAWALKQVLENSERLWARRNHSLAAAKDALSAVSRRKGVIHFIAMTP